MVNASKVVGMPNRFTAAQEALSKFGNLEWFRLSAGTHPLYEHHQLTHMGWRYENRSTEIADAIHRIIGETDTQFEWKLDSGSRNWILAPSRVLTECSPGLENFHDVAHSIKIDDQDFCVRSLSDFDEIIHHWLCA
jgi:hypothetical protein